MLPALLAILVTTAMYIAMYEAHNQYVQRSINLVIIITALVLPVAAALEPWQNTSLPFEARLDDLLARYVM